MIEHRGGGTVRITKVKGHADESMVKVGRVRELDGVGTNTADEAADFGRLGRDLEVIGARRNFSGVCRRWYPVVMELHGFCHCFFACCCESW